MNGNVVKLIVQFSFREEHYVTQMLASRDNDVPVLMILPH